MTAAHPRAARGFSGLSLGFCRGWWHHCLLRSLPCPCLQVRPKNSVLLPVRSPRGAGAASASSWCCCTSEAPRDAGLGPLTLVWASPGEVLGAPSAKMGMWEEVRCFPRSCFPTTMLQPLAILVFFFQLITPPSLLPCGGLPARILFPPLPCASTSGKRCGMK